MLCKIHLKKKRTFPTTITLRILKKDELFYIHTSDKRKIVHLICPKNNTNGQYMHEIILMRNGNQNHNDIIIHTH